MRQGAGRRGDHEEGHEPPRPETARHGAAERQQPDRVDAEMNPAAMDQRIGEEGPHLGAEPAGQHAAGQNARFIADRIEGHQAEHQFVLARRQQIRAHEMDRGQQGEQADDHRWDIEGWFASQETGSGGEAPLLPLLTASSQGQGTKNWRRRGKEKGRAFALPEPRIAGSLRRALTALVTSPCLPVALNSLGAGRVVRFAIQRRCGSPNER